MENNKNIQNEDVEKNPEYRLSIITTRQGDYGQSSLSDGMMRYKFDLEFELIGTIDESNSYLGLIYSQLMIELEGLESLEKLKGLENLEQEELILFYHQSLINFKMLQNQMFDLGAEISAPLYVKAAYLALEKLDVLNQDLIKLLPPLTEFILPSGSLLASYAHIARTVTRRAERIFWQLYQTHAEKKSSESCTELSHFILIGKYLNRLSDYLFNYARYSHQRKNIGDVCWQNENKNKNN